MPDRSAERWVVGLGAVLLLVLALFLPSVLGKIYASPDETAVAVVASELAEHGQAFLEDPQVRLIPWLHARSWVSLGERVVPVGFLAWPWLLHWVAYLHPAVLSIAASLLILSGAIPWYALIRARWGWRWATVATSLVFFFPTFLLYLNRSLFANVAQVSSFFWVLWLLDRSPSYSSRRKKQLIRLITGLLIALTCWLRPVEMVWLVPWMAWFWSLHPPKTEDRRWIWGGIFLISLPLGWLAYATYGSWFSIGYFFHDNASSLFSSVLRSSVDVSTSNTSLSQMILPYGFHPRHIWWNIIHFFVEFLWPWTFSLLGLLVWAVHTRVFDRRQLKLSWVPLLLGAWTIVFLLFVYGSGLYADHIRPGTIAVGNSFLRYVLPLVPLWVLTVLWLARRLSTTSWQRSLLLIGWSGLLLAGVYWAFMHDDEGLVFTRRELVRYSQIRSSVQQLLSDRAIILSERSDKIFFPQMRGVAPLPSIEHIRIALSLISDPVYVFVRPMSATQRDAWRAAGIDVTPLTAFGREKLYRLSLFQR